MFGLRSLPTATQLTISPALIKEVFRPASIPLNEQLFVRLGAEVNREIHEPRERISFKAKVDPF